MLDHRYHDDEGLAGAQYFAKFADGSQRQGTLDAQGRALIEGIPPGPVQVSFGPMPGAFERKDKTPTPEHDPNPTEAKLASLVDKYLSTSTDAEAKSA